MYHESDRYRSSRLPSFISSVRFRVHYPKEPRAMGSMHTGLEELPDGHKRMAAFYGERARGGVGLIVTGGIGRMKRALPIRQRFV